MSRFHHVQPASALKNLVCNGIPSVRRFQENDEPVRAAAGLLEGAQPGLDLVSQRNLKIEPWIYIMQNTMVRGERGKWPAGGKKLEVWKKRKKEKRGKITLKKGKRL